MGTGRDNAAAVHVRIVIIKYLLFAFNIIYLMVGLSLMSLGAWLRTDSRFRELLSERYRRVVPEAVWQMPTVYFFSYILIILGSSMIVVAFVGCCGAIRENRCLLITYFSCIMLLFVASLSSGIYILYKQDGIDNELSDALTYMVQHYYQGAGVVQESLDHLQQTFRCCGNAGCGDFRDLHMDVPRSCDIRCDGCRYRIWQALRIGFTITAAIFSIVLISQLLTMALSLYMFCVSRSPIEQFLASTHNRHNGQQQNAAYMHGNSPGSGQYRSDIGHIMRYQQLSGQQQGSAEATTQCDGNNFYVYDVGTNRVRTANMAS